MAAKAQDDDDLSLLEYDDPEFIAAFRHYCGLRGWSWLKLSQETGIAQSAVLKWRRNLTTPTIANLHLLCRAFGVTRSEFFGKGEGLAEEHRERLRREVDTSGFLEMTSREVRDWIAELDPAGRGRLLEKLETVTKVARRYVEALQEKERGA